MSATEKAALLPVLAVAFICGLIVAEHWDVPTGSVALLIIAAALGTGVSVAIRFSLLPALAITVALLGMLRAGLVEAPAADLVFSQGESDLAVRGEIVDRPADHGRASSFQVSLNQIRVSADSPWAVAAGDIRVTAVPTTDLVNTRDAPFFRYGDRLELAGRLDAPEPLGDFDFPAYLERQGITSVMAFPDVQLISEGGGNAARRWLSSLRIALAGSLDSVIPEPQAAFGQAVLLGVRDGLPDSLLEDFRRTGTSHLLAISGLHVGMVLVMTTAASALAFGRRAGLYLLLPLGAVWLYALLAGAPPSAMRAALMGTAYLAAMVVGRPRSLTPGLALAAIVMTAIDPMILVRVSFQLSFAAMLGIGLYIERASDRVSEVLGIRPEASGFRIAAARAVVGAAGITLAATLATAPLVGLYFGQLSLVGLPSTLLTLPVVPIALMFHAAAAIVGLGSELAAQPLGWLAWGFSSYVLGVVSGFARLPGASVSVGDAGVVLVWAYYSILGLWAFTLCGNPLGARRLRRISTIVGLVQSSAPPWQLAAIAIMGASLVWVAVVSQPGGRLKVVFADVGQGDMTVVMTPGGGTIVVDGGPNPARAVEVLGSQLPFWRRNVDLVVLTHPHDDHVSGANEILRRYSVERVMERRQDFEGAEYASWAKLVKAEGAETVQAVPGSRVTFPDGVTIEVLGPPDPLLSNTRSDVDNGSVVVRVVYGDRSFLITGDLFGEGERWLVGSGQPLTSDVLKVAHHGSRTSSSEIMLDAVSPAAVTVSAGADNRFGHPHAEIVDRLAAAVGSTKVFTTAERGSVTFETDGVSMWVSTER